MSRLLDFLADRRGWLAFVLATVTLVALVGLSRLRFDDGYRSIFRSEEPEYLLLDQLSRQFGSNDNDLVAVLDSPDLLRFVDLDVVRRIHHSLLEVEGVESVYSILSLPQLAALAEKGESASDELGRLRAEILNEPLLEGKLISRDGRTSLLLAYLGDRELSVAELEPLLGQIRDVVTREAAASEVNVRLTGIPAMRLDIVRGVQRDQVKFNVVGLTLAGALAVWIFRRPAAIAVVALAPVIGVVWTLGAMGWAGEPLNVFNNVLPQLMLIIGFTDAVHLLFFFRREKAAGLDNLRAALSSARHVGLACALTSLTTAVGFGSLVFARTELIQHFGTACAAGTVISFCAVVTIVPLLSSTRLGDRVVRDNGRDSPDNTGAGLDVLVDPLLRRPMTVTVVGMVLLAALVTACLQLRPDYRYRDYLQTDGSIYQAIAHRERVFGGTMPIHAWVTWPNGQALRSPQVLETLATVEQIFHDTPNMYSVGSVRMLLRALPGRGDDLPNRVPFLGYLPPELVRRWINREERQALVTGLVPDLGSARLNPLLDDLDRRLAEAVRVLPGSTVRLAGLAVVSARGSEAMLSDLARSLGGATIVILAVILWVFRSVKLGLASLLPNLLPLAGVGAILYWTETPLQYATIAVFSIGLGLAVDDTIHFLTAFRRDYKNDVPVELAVRRSLRLVGTALLTTTVLLVAGFGTLGLSELPMLRLFGYLCCVCFAIALIADLFLLPSILVLLFRKRTG